MKTQVMAVYDTAQECFGRPFFCRRAAEGVRMFAAEVNRKDENNLLYKYPEQFHLYSLGEFDEETGVFSGKSEMVMLAVNCKEEVSVHVS